MTGSKSEDRADILPGGANRFDLAGKSNVVAGLVAASASIVNEMWFVLPDGSRNKDLDHVWSILSALEPLSLELAEMCDGIQSMPAEVGA